MKSEIILPDENVIDIAYDRKNGRYIAYNLYTKVFSYGVCVETAVEAYKEALLNKNTEDEAAIYWFGEHGD
jgi:hypothetical protein